ncbi:ABC transporter permease [Butyrivibrio sp. WCD3002]|uniref:ABC transporter permease n=1 Tax=Butyrivibrio sp. WCD3002 TaxID=1280676 RepID=UPI000415C796|nr:ABC transporter permease [Butyrivibrio sp. WCD3002]
MNKKKGILQSNVLYTIIAIIIGFIIGAIFLAIAHISPIEAYSKLLSSVVSKPKYWFWTLTYASPIILTGLSVAFSFRTGVFNIGAEGQFVVGSLAATVIGILLDLPAVIHIPLCLIAAAAAGCLWSLICGIMKVKKGIHEVLSFIMFNWIAYYLSNYAVNTEILHKVGGGEATKDLHESARLLFPKSIIALTGCSAANAGIIIAIVLAVVVWIIIEKTTLGYKLKAVGFNKFAAQYAGIDSDKSILTALGISGALAGLGGAVQTMGMGGRLAQFASQEGYGFEGITVALIGGSNPIGVIFSGIFYGAMKYGGSKLTLINAPSEIINIIMGCVVIFIAIAHVFKALLLNLSKKKEAK